jgi:hypothetical protein
VDSTRIAVRSLDDIVVDLRRLENILTRALI